VDEAKLRQLRPDVIVTQSDCEVCAVSLRDVEKAVGEWLETRPRIVSLSPNCLEEVWENIRQVAEALQVPDEGLKLVDRLRQRMKAITQKAATRSQRPTVACLEWIDPLMAAGNWMPELVTMAGGLNVFGEAGKHSPLMSWEDLRAKDPGVIVVLPCGFDIARSREDMPVLVAKPGWTDLKAVRNRSVFLADGNQYFNRPGPRLVESLEILAEVCHPGVFHFGHEGSGWQSLWRKP
jgi:iron complex transport system substrate-binding protein